MRKQVVSRSPVANKIDDADGQLIKQRDLYDHLNETVFKPVLGVELSRHAVRDLVIGIANQVMILTLSGARVRFGRLGTFFPNLSNAGTCYDFKAKRSYRPPARMRLAFKPSVSTRQAFDVVNGAE